SRYEGKKLPQTTKATKRVLPVFPELLDKVTVSWKDRPFSGKSQIQGASSLDFEGMEKLGIHRMPPMQPLVAAHLHHGCKHPPKTPHCHPRQTVLNQP
ncbi:hypothetical protein XENOCAPTIV_027117, partial [Xenoophorus captivus]